MIICNFLYCFFFIINIYCITLLLLWSMYFRTYLKHVANLCLVSIGFSPADCGTLQFFILSNHSISSNILMTWKYLDNLSSWSSNSIYIYKRRYSPDYFLFLLISCAKHHSVFFIFWKAKNRRGCSSSEPMLNNNIKYKYINTETRCNII